MKISSPPRPSTPPPSLSLIPSYGQSYARLSTCLPDRSILSSYSGKAVKLVPVVRALRCPSLDWGPNRLNCGTGRQRRRCARLRNHFFAIFHAQAPPGAVKSAPFFVRRSVGLAFKKGIRLKTRVMLFPPPVLVMFSLGEIHRHAPPRSLGYERARVIAHVPTQRGYSVIEVVAGRSPWRYRRRRRGPSSLKTNGEDIHAKRTDQRSPLHLSLILRSSARVPSSHFRMKACRFFFPIQIFRGVMCMFFSFAGERSVWKGRYIFFPFLSF